MALQEAAHHLGKLSSGLFLPYEEGGDAEVSRPRNLPAGSLQVSQRRPLEAI